MQTSNSDGAYFFLAIFIFLVVLVTYFIPWLIGKRRDLSGTGILFFVNFMFGWTGLGWLMCMAWAVFGQTNAQRDFYENARRRTEPKA